MSPQGILIAAVIALIASFGSGWAVNGWRLGKDIERLDGQVSTLKGANARCDVAVADVKGAVKDLFEQGEKRAARAEKAVADASAAAKVHLGQAQAALSRPPAKAGEECLTAAMESAAYAQRRRAEVRP